MIYNIYMYKSYFCYFSFHILYSEKIIILRVCTNKHEIPNIKTHNVHVATFSFREQNNFQFVIKNTICDENGQYVICELELSNERIIVTNFYGLNTDKILLPESQIKHFFSFHLPDP
jgi:hypothetical protein